MPNISWLSRLVGVGPRFQRTLIDLLSFGYKCRSQEPLLNITDPFITQLSTLFEKVINK